jgi:hypothetical protein
MRIQSGLIWNGADNETPPKKSKEDFGDSFANPANLRAPQRKHLSLLNSPRTAPCGRQIPL